MQDIFIIGTGGFAREVYNLIRTINKEESSWRVKGFIDIYSTEDELYNLPIHKSYNVIARRENKVNIVIAIGDPTLRRKIYETEMLKYSNIQYPNIIHPNVDTTNIKSFGFGNIICEGTIISIDVFIQDFVIVNVSSTIGHDVNIESFVTINPNSSVSGGVEVGFNTLLGVGSVILQNLKIGNNVIVGAGATVFQNVKCGYTVIGNPARAFMKK